MAITIVMKEGQSLSGRSLKLEKQISGGSEPLPDDMHPLPDQQEEEPQGEIADENDQISQGVRV